MYLIRATGRIRLTASCLLCVQLPAAIGRGRFDVNLIRFEDRGEDSLAVSAAAAGVTPKRLHSRVERANLGPFSAQRHTCISSEQTVIASYHLCEATLRKTAGGDQKISEQRL